MKYEEIGEAKKVETVDLEAVVHVRGNAALEADLIRRLQDEGKGQAEIGHLMGLSQGAVSKRLALFGLIPKLLERLRKGEIGANVAYRLAKLPKAEQAKFAAQEKVTLKAVDARHREIVVSDDLKALLAEPLSQGTQVPVEAEGSLLERLAALEHEQWVAWSKDIAAKEKLSEARLLRWKGYWVPYSELSDEVKRQDRDWALKVLAEVRK